MKRSLYAIPTLLVVVSLVFLLVRVAPGDPAVAALGEHASQDAIEAARERMGLDDPLWEQYRAYLGSLVRGDLGVSLISGRPVTGDVMAALPHTLELTGAAVLIGLTLGIPLALWASVRRNRWPDYLSRVTSLAGLSFPAFHLGILLILVFAVRLDWFPATGAGGWSQPAENLHHLALPALTLGLITTAYVTRVTRSTLLTVQGEDHVRTARSKGLGEGRVMFWHMLRPALLPVASLVGVFTITLLGSAVTTEVVFARPGIGRLLVQATLQRDYNMIQSVMTVVALLVVAVNLATDLVYGLLNPKVRHAR